jgi:cysteinyl-tRNA synthetase
MELQKALVILMITLCFVASSGCTDSTDNTDSEGKYPRTVATISGKEVDTFLYILQDIDISAIAASDYDLVIMDYSMDGTDTSAFTSAELKILKDSGKLVLCYISIGEAEDYRYYWEENWTVGDPEFIVEENPEWEGNYKVAYWELKWQDIVYSGNDSYLDRIIDAGFDGLYLDIIDAYEYFEETGRGTAAGEMVEFVINITHHSRERDPDFLIVPQNGEALLDFDDYLNTISGQGKEDLYFTDDQEQDPQETHHTIGLLANASEAGKVVLVTDYMTTTEDMEKFYSRAAEDGFLAFAGNRELNRIPELD